MKSRFLTAGLCFLGLLASDFVVAAPQCATVLEQDQGYFIAESKKVAFDHKNYSLSKLALAHYCLFYGSSELTAKKALLLNKKNGFSYSVDHFFTAQQSPNSHIVSVLSGKDENSMNSIALFDEQGVVPYNSDLHDVFNFGRESFYSKFSADSKFLMFYQHQEDSLFNYVVLNIATGRLTAHLTRYEDHKDALALSPFTRDSEFAFLEPASDTEFAARSQNGYLAYYANKTALWVVKTGSVKILAVGNVYVVVQNQAGGIDFYRKKDGKKYSIMAKLKTEDANPWILGSRFIDHDTLFIEFQGDEDHEIGRILLNLTNKTVKELP